MVNLTERRMYVLILSDDEYINWLSSFEDKADAEAAAKLATENRRDSDDFRTFYVSDYPFFVAGTRLTLDQLKGEADEYDYDDDLWKLTDEERADDLDYDEVERELGKLADVEPGKIRLISRQEFEGLPGPRALAVSDWALSLVPELDDMPEELSPSWKAPSPGQLPLGEPHVH
jgi:hypothetical protein